MCDVLRDDDRGGPTIDKPEFSMMKGIVISLAAFSVFATLVPLIRRTDWWIRAFDFPRLQIASLGVLSLALYPLVFEAEMLDAIVLALTGAATGWQLWRILPYTPLFRKQVRSARDVSPRDTIGVVVANVLTPNRGAKKLLAEIHKADPDIILAVETDQWWQDQLAPLERDYRFTLKYPLDNLYGMHLYSRLPLKDPEIRFLVQDDIPSMHAQVVMHNGHVVEMHCLHPTPPSPTENDTSDERDAELLVVGRDLRAGNRSVIVAGDLNDVAWSDTTNLFQKISGLLDPRIGRGRLSSFHAKYWFIRWPLDHLFHSDDFTLVSMRRLAKFGSDHFPIHVVLHHEPPAENLQQGPEADREEESLVEQKIEQGNAQPL